MSTSNENGKGTTLITGASTGIGAIYADRIAKRGYDLILVARNGERLNAVADRIRKETGRTVRVQVADLNNKADLKKVEELLKTDKTITGLVNNAGVGSVTPLLETDVDKMEDMIDLNITALTRLTYAAVPGFVARGKGTIVNIASVVGISPETLNGVYGATKSYVIGFTQSLQHELAEKGLRIQAVLPGATATEFWDVAGYPHSNLPKEMVMSAEDLVDAALVGLERGEVITIPPLQDGKEWETWEAARKAMSTRLSNAKPGARYAKA
jgi:short-subunit dehydrogenase